MGIALKELEKIEILTLMDNYIDLVVQENSAVIQRAMPLKGMEVRNSVLAEHGFSSYITVSDAGQSGTLMFDFGFSEHGAAFNAKALGVNLSAVEIMALSHGHLDHVGGLAEISELIGKKGLKLVLHPAAFKNPRYLKITDDFRLTMPSFSPEKAATAGIELIETQEPYLMLQNGVCFLGEIPRLTDFEKGAANLCCQVDGVEQQDPIEDDSAVIGHLKGKGLVVLSGCAHSGIINTVRHAQAISGVEKIHAVMGGFHLTGPDSGPVVEQTIEALKEIDPDYIVPTHCTGRQAVMAIEREMPDKFILNMAGTKLTFTA